MPWIKKNWDIVVSYTLLLLAIVIGVGTALNCKSGHDPLCGLAALIMAFFPLIGSFIFAVVVLARTFSSKISRWRLCWLIPHALIAVALIALAGIIFSYRHFNFLRLSYTPEIRKTHIHDYQTPLATCFDYQGEEKKKYPQ